MNNCKSVTTPLMANVKLSKENGSEKADGRLYKSLIESLLYLTITRTNIMYAASLASRFMQNPNQIYFNVAKHILRYLKGMKNYGIWHKLCVNSKLFDYTDSGLNQQMA